MSTNGLMLRPVMYFVASILGDVDPNMAFVMSIFGGIDPFPVLTSILYLVRLILIWIDVMSSFGFVMTVYGCYHWL